MDPSFPVRVYVYDLSGGLAPVLAPAMLGINIQAVYHTSVVVHGKEYYIDQGIRVATPGKTKYGLPIEVLDYGETYVTADIFEEFIDGLKDEFTAASYHLFDKNCNHFTDSVVEFAVGRRLEDRILGLPEVVRSALAMA